MNKLTMYKFEEILKEDDGTYRTEILPNGEISAYRIADRKLITTLRAQLAETQDALERSHRACESWIADCGEQKRKRQEVEDALERLRDEVHNKCIISYSTGYEDGHHDTVESTFLGNGQTQTHDCDALEWLIKAETDGTFDRAINT